jgi:hypothetical protein
MELRAFHNDEAVKEKYLTRVRHHQKMDHLVRGQGWTGKKGCAVGCTLEKYDHKAYEPELGIPEWLARVEDTLFEGMSEEKSRTWPEKFLEAIHIGVDLEKAKVPFLIVVLEDTLVSMDKTQYDKEKWPNVTKAIEGSKAAVRQMIEAQKSGDKKLIEAARSAAYSAYSAAYSAADSAADSAAYSARSAARSAADSADSAAYSARSAAYSADSAAYSARSAARSAAYSADSAAYSADSAAYSADSAAYSAYSAAYDHYADELLRILKSVKPRKRK